MRFPIDEKYPLTNPFGAPDEDRQSKIHNGEDYGTPVGIPVYAPTDGKTYRVYRDNASMGNAVYFKCDNGKWWFRFLHLSSVMPPGAYKEGDIIGYTGNTGTTSRGAHLHIEAWLVPISVAILYTEKSVRKNLVAPSSLFTNQ